MLRHDGVKIVLVLSVLSLLTRSVFAQPCVPEWWDQFDADEFNGIVHALTVFDDDGDGPNPPALYAGGAFAEAGGAVVNHIARWNGTSWSPLDEGLGGAVFALAVFDEDGDGPFPPALYAGGNFTTASGSTTHRIARWNGAYWSQVGGGMNNVVYALVVYDEDDEGPILPALYAGGLFVTAGGTAVNRIAKWDGTTWSPLGAGMNNYVAALTVFDDGGPFPAALYAGGGFTTAGGIAANRIARWNGKDWTSLDSGSMENGLNLAAYCLVVFDDDDDGPGAPALYVGGRFTTAGDISAERIVKWDGASWSPLGSGVDLPVWALEVFDHDSSGPEPPALYAGGYFTTAGGISANRIARWDGTSWSPLGDGMDGGVRALVVFDDDPNDPALSALYTGGEFTTAGGLPAGRIAKWGCPPFPPSPPEILAHPESQTVCEGDGVAFTVTASGTPPLQYQWRRDGVDIAGAAGASYTIDPVALNDAAWYDVVVSNGLGTATSDPAFLTVNAGSTVVEHPESQTVCEGWAVTFTVTAEGSEPLSYQWRYDGVPIDGATGTSYAIDPVSVGDAGEYDVVVTNVCAAVTSDPAVLTVNTGPAIAEQPSSQAACEGDAATFTVTAEGTAPLTYQWRRYGDPIGGATEASYTIDPVTAGDAGVYDVRVANSCGSTTSDSATLTVEVGPSIAEQPQSQAVCEDETVTFTVAAGGTEPLGYQWHQDGQPIDGATDASYTIDAVTAADAGVYDVVVTNGCGSVTSDPATLTVYSNPTVIEQPQSQSVCEGEAVTFTVTAGGAEPLSYQWRQDGQPIDGATDTSYTIDPVTTSEAGDYDVVVTNACGSATSDPATLTVDVGPAITEQPQSQSVCDGEAVTFTVMAEGVGPLSYQWRQDGQPIDGATDTSYTIDPVTIADAAEYDVAVTNPCGSVISSPAILAVYTGPTITAQPQSQTVCEGDAITLIVVAEGVGPLSCQWRHDGQPIAGATGTSYTIDPVTVADAGEYDVVVTNMCGSVTSAPALLTVNAGPAIVEQPQPQAVCEGAAVTFTVTAEGTEPLTYQWRRDDDPIGGATEASYTIDLVTAADAGAYNVRVANLCGSVTSDPATLAVYTRPVISEPPQSQSVCEGDAVVFTVVADGMEPLEYQWRKDSGVIPGAIEASYTIDPVALSDAGEYDVLVTSPCGSTTSDAATLTVGVGPAIIEQPQPQSACEGGAVTFTVTASGTEPLSYQWRHDAAPIDGATGASHVIDPVVLEDAGEYDVVVANSCGSLTSVPALLTVNPGPAIVEQPQSQAACEGDAVTFAVTASGMEPLEYQWRQDGQDIAGATETAYVIDPVAADDAGTYDVVVTNPCGSVTSDPAVLTAYAGPSIIEQPQSQTVCEDDTVTFVVTADGMEPLEYQWRQDGQDIAGAIAASYVIELVEPGDAGEYDVIVTSACGSVTSDPATLAVNAGATITTQPQSQSVCEGDAVELNVTASGTGPLSYQWRHDGQPIAGATDPSYALDPASTADAGGYDVVVTNPCGSVTSDPAMLAVDAGALILEQPQSQSVCKGGAVTFAVTADGIEPLEYQWRKAGQAVAGVTQASYSIDPVTADDAGEYDVVITNPCGVVVSDPATLAVGEGPTITEQPQSKAVCEGDAVTLSVAANGIDSLEYQWRKDGQPVAGAVGAAYVIDPVEPADTGAYDVVVTGACGSVTSDTATLAVNVGAAITKQPQPRSVCVGDAATFGVTASGTAPLEYQWRWNGNAVAGATGRLCTIDPVFADDAGQYDVVVTSPCGSVTSAAARLTVDAGPVIVAPPQSQSVCESDVATLSVTVDGTGPLSYQWHKDGQPVDHATEAAWTVDSARAEDAGRYHVVVVNACGSAASDPATLTVETCTSLPSEPAGPSPADGASAVAIDVELAWGAVAGAASYEVYFGTSDPPGLLGTTSNNNWNAGELAYETTYYWQVVAQNEAGITAGATWSFTTVSFQDTDPTHEPADEIMPPGCGAGACGVGYAGTAPLTLLCLCSMKCRLHRNRQRNREGSATH